MSDSPLLVVGLGNPGREYAESRHNVGFMVVDRLCEQGRGTYREKFHGEIAKIDLDGASCVLLKPQTYMNESGTSVQPASAFMKVAPSGIIVVHDEVDLPFGDVRIKQGGGHAGHNGLRSILQHLGSADFLRIRVGVGRPPAGFGGEMADYVLGGFNPSERAELSDVVARAVRAIERIVDVGASRAMNELNARPKTPKGSAAEAGETSGKKPATGRTSGSSCEPRAPGPEKPRAPEPEKPGETKNFAPCDGQGGRDRSAWC